MIDYVQNYLIVGLFIIAIARFDSDKPMPTGVAAAIILFWPIWIIIVIIVAR